MKIIIIGVGGVGGIVARIMSKYALKDGINIVLVDGDEYEEKNQDRQFFKGIGPKAEVTADDITGQIIPIVEYFSDKNKDIIGEGDFVFACVDNFTTRLQISKRCQELDNITLISGGNELFDGNIQIYMKRLSKALTPTIEDYHPEIANPTDKSPAESCEERASTSEPQLIFANNTVACLMCNSAWHIHTEDQKEIKTYPEYQEAYFDIRRNVVMPRKRILREEEVKING